MNSFTRNSPHCHLLKIFTIPPETPYIYIYIYKWTDCHQKEDCTHGRHLGIRIRHQLDYILVKCRFRNSVKNVHTLPGADINSDHNLLVAKVRTRLKKMIIFQKTRPRWDLEKLCAQRQRVQDTLEEKLGEIECESWNVEVK
jgi:hypothetical protein